MIDSNEVLARIESKLYDLESKFNEFMNVERSENGLESQAFEPTFEPTGDDITSVDPSMTTDIDVPSDETCGDNLDPTLAAGGMVQMGDTNGPIDEPGETGALEGDEELELDGETEEGEVEMDDLGGDPQLDSEEPTDEFGGEGEEPTGDIPSGEGDEQYDTLDDGEDDIETGDDDDTEETGEPVVTDVDSEDESTDEFGGEGEESTDDVDSEGEESTDEFGGEGEESTDDVDSEGEESTDDVDSEGEESTDDVDSEGEESTDEEDEFDEEYEY